MAEDKNVERRQRFAARVRSLMLRLLVVWFVVSFGFGILMVEPLNEIRLGGYKLGFWFAQQGSIFIFIALIFAFSSVMTRLERDYVDGEKESENESDGSHLFGCWFYFCLYIGIAIATRASSTKDFYVADGGVHPVANGMATAADWMSAASFISMAGLIALSYNGYGGSVFLMGWTGGYVLLALLIAPYLRKYGKYTSLTLSVSAITQIRRG